jgi:hypothetical protein
MLEDISNPWDALQNPRIWNDLAIQRRLKDEFPHFSTITDKWGFIRQVYMEHLPIIVEISKKNIRGKINPYFIDWLIDFTHIEIDAWNSIRGKGVPLYPQFPLLNFFVDFANPFLKVGLELDGRDWHNEEKDRERDQLLARYGWKIFRIKGSETTVPFRLPIELEEAGVADEERCHEIENWLLNTADGVITSIDYVYFLRRPFVFDSLCLRSLDKHRLAQFELLEEQENE